MFGESVDITDKCFVSSCEGLDALKVSRVCIDRIAIGNAVLGNVLSSSDVTKVYVTASFFLI